VLHNEPRLALAFTITNFYHSRLISHQYPYPALKRTNAQKCICLPIMGRFGSGGARAVKSQVISRSENPQAKSDDLWGCTFPQKSRQRFLVVALRAQAANAADCFTVKIKQIRRSEMVTFVIFCFHTLPMKQSSRQGGARAVDLPVRSFDLARPGVAPPLRFGFGDLFCNAFCINVTSTTTIIICLYLSLKQKKTLASRSCSNTPQNR